MGWTGAPLNKNDMTFASLWNTIQDAGAHSSTPNSLGTSPVPSSIRLTDSVSHTYRGLPARRDSSRYTNRHAPEPPDQDQDRGGDATMFPEDMASLIRGYLPMMSTPDKPPFVHGQLYRQSEGPIARAMVCTNALAGATPSSRGFAHDIVEAERDRLIKAFVRSTPTRSLIVNSLPDILGETTGL